MKQLTGEDGCVLQRQLPRFVDDFVSYELFFSEQQKERLFIWYDLLHKWQKKINLISPKTINEVWRRHFMDALQLGLYLSVKKTCEYVDLGSGAGFPGLAIALFADENMVLVESDQRKSSFLRAVVREWGAQDQIVVLNKRIENLKEKKFDVVSARALAPLNQLLYYALPLLKKQSFCLFLKGKAWESEVKEAQQGWCFDYEVQESLSDSKAMILKIMNVKEKV